MKQKLTQERVFALRGWSIKTQRGKFYAAPTAYFDDTSKWLGPFKSLQATAAAISRKLAEEFLARSQRMEAFDAKQHRKDKRAQRSVQNRRAA